MIISLIITSVYTFITSAILYAIIWLDLHIFIVSSVLLIQTLCIYALKESIRIERPIDSPMGIIGHSFPSSYSANVVFLCIYFVWLFYYNRKSWPLLVFRIGGISVYSIGVIYLRYTMNYNYLLDIIVGIVIGVLFAIAFIKFQLQYNQIIKYN